MTLYRGDCVKVMNTLPVETIDACITDPPYELGMLGSHWDSTGVSFREETWGEVWCLLKPGAYLAAFSGTRTYHKMATAIDRAGFDIIDMIEWIHGQGVPKSRRYEGGRGTSIKPAHEPICLARKPKDGTFAENDEKWGCGLMNIDDARIPLQGKTTEGRFPANVVHDGSDVVLAEFPQSAGCGNKTRILNNNTIATKDQLGLNRKGSFQSVLHGDGMGSAARFMYCAKASKKEKEHGAHTTQKPVNLMRWLIRLLVPHGGIVIDPFLGSGTTAVAAVQEGRRWIGIEKDGGYAAIAEARIAYPDWEDR